MTVDIILLDGTALRLMSEIQVRDLLIAGMGDRSAAGEGNPDRAVRLSDEGFCFKRFEGGEYYRPGRRASAATDRAIPLLAMMPASATGRGKRARWMSGPCHRSLYSYQMRTALALAIDNHTSRLRFFPSDVQARPSRRVFSRASAHASAEPRYRRSLFGNARSDQRIDRP